MPKGFQKGHETSIETRKKIGDALRKSIYFNCAYCAKESFDNPSSYKRKKRHFCSTICYSKYRSDILPKEEQPSWRGGVTSYESHKKWVKNNPKKVAHLKARYYARKRNAEGSHTFEEWEKLKRLNNNKCAKCKESKKLTKDHIKPLSLGGSDYITNIQPLCRNCNSKKWKHENKELLK